MKKLKEFYYDDILYTCLLDYSIVLLLNFLYFMSVHTLQIYFCLVFCFVTASNLMMSGFILLSFFFSLMHLLSVLVKLISVLFLFVFLLYICFSIIYMLSTMKYLLKISPAFFMTVPSHSLSWPQTLDPPALPSKFWEYRPILSHLAKIFKF